MNHQATIDNAKLDKEIAAGKYDDSNGNNKQQQAFKLEEERKLARQSIELLSTDRDGQILKKLQKVPEWSNSSTITAEMKASSAYAIAKGELAKEIREAKSKANKASMKINGVPDYPEALNNFELSTLDVNAQGQALAATASLYKIDVNALDRWAKKYPEKGLDELAGTIKYQSSQEKKK